MQISRISMMNPYRTNSVAMKGRKEDEAAIRKFDEFMRKNDLVLTAVISPDKRLNDYTVCATLSKANSEYGIRSNQKSPTPLIATDFDVTPAIRIKGCAKTVKDAKLDIISMFQGKNMGLANGDSEFSLRMPIFNK